VYPNPSNSTINIKFVTNTNTNTKIELYNVLGEVVKSIDLGKQSGTIFQTIDLNNFSSGVYFIKVQNNNQILSKKIIKQ